MPSMYEKGKRATSRKGVKKDTRKIADGTLKRGPGGKMNVYDKASGTWKRAVKSSAAKKRATAASKAPAKKTAVSASQKRRDAAMASRSKTSKSTDSSDSSKTSKTTGGYTAGTGGGSRYTAAQIRGKAAQKKSTTSTVKPTSDAPAAKIRAGVQNWWNNRGKAGAREGQRVTISGVPMIVKSGRLVQVSTGKPIGPSNKSSGSGFIKVTKPKTKEEKYGPGARGR